jgi:hypothetical protein
MARHTHRLERRASKFLAFRNTAITILVWLRPVFRRFVGNRMAGIASAFPRSTDSCAVRGALRARNGGHDFHLLLEKSFLESGQLLGMVLLSRVLLRPPSFLGPGARDLRPMRMVLATQGAPVTNCCSTYQAIPQQRNSAAPSSRKPVVGSTRAGGSGFEGVIHLPVANRSSESHQTPHLFSRRGKNNRGCRMFTNLNVRTLTLPLVSISVRRSDHLHFAEVPLRHASPFPQNARIVYADARI